MDHLWQLRKEAIEAADREEERKRAERKAKREAARKAKAELSDEAPAMRITFPDGFDNFYIVERDLDISQLHYQPEEVLEAKWATKEDIFSMIDDGSFIPYHKSFIEFLFFRRNHSGTRVLGPTQI